MLNGSPAERLVKPIADYIVTKGGRYTTRSVCREILYEQGPDGRPRVTGLRIGSGPSEKIVKADAYVAALDVPGAKRLLPSGWRKYPDFDNIHKLEGVPVITVQLRYDGWITEMKDQSVMKDLKNGPRGMDNLLYSADTDFSCFADLALTSPVEYFR